MIVCRRDSPAHVAFSPTAPSAWSWPSWGWQLLARFVVVFGIAAGFAEPVRGAEEPAETEIVAITIGFDGQYKIGHWTPVRVELRGDVAAAVQVEIIVPDGDGVPSRVATPADRPIELAAGEQHTELLYANVGRLQGQIEVRLRSSDRVLATKILGAKESGAVAAETERILVVGAASDSDSSPDGVDAILGAPVSRVADIHDLPDAWYGYDGVDVVVLETGQPDIYQPGEVLRQRIEVLDEWVRRGGSLLLSVAGKQAALVGGDHAAGEDGTGDGPLARFAPGRPTVPVALRETTALENYVETNERIATAVAGGRAQRLDVLGMSGVLGRIEADAGSEPGQLPLVVRTPRGFGQIVFVTIELEQPLIRGWPAQRQFYDRLLHRPRAAAREDRGSSTGQVTTVGFTDLSGQLRGALDQFAGVPLIPFWAVAVLVSLYVILLAAEYFLLRRLGNMFWTWMTFPLLLLVFGAAAYGLTDRLKGDQIRANQAEVVDIDVESGFTRATAWTRMFSPRLETYDVGLVARLADGQPAEQPDKLLCWMGLPGAGFGGMDAGGAGFGGAASASGLLFDSPYTFATDLDHMQSVPIPIWSTKGFTSRWFCRAPSELESNLVESGQTLLAGSLTSNLSAPLVDCVLLFDRWAYVVGSLEPGVEIDVEHDLEPQTIENYFKRVSSVGDTDAATPYDRRSFDVSRIVTMMMFYDAAGGYGYTGLSNRYQQFVDLSHLLKAGRAILLGRSTAPCTLLRGGGETLTGSGGETWVWHRYVLPVQAPGEKRSSGRGTGPK